MARPVSWREFSTSHELTLAFRRRESDNLVSQEAWRNQAIVRPTKAPAQLPPGAWFAVGWATARLNASQTDSRKEKDDVVLARFGSPALDATRIHCISARALATIDSGTLGGAARSLK